MDKPQPIVVTLITTTISGICITNKQKWIKILEELKKLDPKETIDFSENIDLNDNSDRKITIKKILENIKVYESRDHLHAYQLLCGESKYIGIDLMGEIKDGIGIINDVINYD